MYLFVGHKKCKNWIFTKTSKIWDCPIVVHLATELKFNTELFNSTWIEDKISLLNTPLSMLYMSSYLILGIALHKNLHMSG